jgi:hypothetical protein
MGEVAVLELTRRREGAETQRQTTHERAVGIVFVLLAVAGVVLGWDKGRLPEREPMRAAEATAGREIAPDLALYRDVIAGVRSGRRYYEVAGEKIPQYGFPIASPLNWRMPTYAWLLSPLPNKCWIQAVLLLLAIAGLWLSFVAVSRRWGVPRAGLTTVLLFGVVRWTFDGYAYLAQEVWAAVLLLISLAALAIAECSAKTDEGRDKTLTFYRWLAIAAGILSLLFRELALPYCVAACAVAAWKRRWWEAASWTAGIALFLAFFAWHVGQVKAQLIELEVTAAAGGGLSQWLRFGGLDFVLLTTRMNSLLFAAPSWLLWLYVLLALVGLSRSRGQVNETACVAALLYLLAFAAVGRPENFYWGLMAAPLLAWGAASGVISILDQWQRKPSVA